MFAPRRASTLTYLQNGYLFQRIVKQKYRILSLNVYMYCTARRLSPIPIYHRRSKVIPKLNTV